MHTSGSLAAALVAGAAAVFAISTAAAQARAGDASTAASPLLPVFAQFEESLAPRLIGADDAASRWIAGRLATLEPDAQARDYAAAVAREPKELLFVASLAQACMPATASPPPECNTRDAVGYWTSRDPDNAVPWLLQAERARRRNNAGALVENLERASRAAGYATYDHRAGALLFAKLAPVASPGDRGAAAVYAMSVPAGSGTALLALEGVCAPASRGLDPRIPAACLRLASLMAERAALLNDRRAGTQVALAVAATDSARALASGLARDVVAQQDRCREASSSLERLALGTPAQRERAATLGEQFLADRARGGEAPACEALARALAAR